MSDAAIAQEPIEPVPPAPPGPEATAELDTAPGHAADGLAPATDEGAVAPTELPPALYDASSEVPSGDARTLPFEIEHPVGPIRQAILDHLVDSEGPQTVAQFIAALGNLSRGTVESALKREFDAGRIERVAAGTYVLAKAPEPKPAPPPEPVVRSDGHTDEEWLAWLGDWRATSRWDGPGNPPGQAGCAVPPGVIAKHNDRLRKRQERQRDRGAALARQAAADQELRTKLLHACNGNYSSSLSTDDLSSIKSVLEIVPIDRVLTTIRCKVDKRSYPANPTLLSWSDPVLLKEIAENYCRTMIVPRLVDAWSKAGTAPATKARESSPPAAPMADIDELRSHHDDPHAPPGPHNLPKPDAAPSAPDTAQKPADASELLPAVSSHPQTGKRIDGATAAA